MIVGSHGRPAYRPGVPALVLTTLLAVTACHSTPPAPAATATPAAELTTSPAPKAAGANVPDVVAPGWRRAGDLDIRFTVDKPQAPGGARTLRVHAVLTVDDTGQVRAMRTAQSNDGVVALRTEWDGGPTTTMTRMPGCSPATEPAKPPAGVADWLAEPFGPVDPATAAGWTVEGETATRPGSTAETLERAPLTGLAERTVREVNRASGALVTEVHDITVAHTPGATPPPACGAPWTG